MDDTGAAEAAAATAAAVPASETSLATLLAAMQQMQLQIKGLEAKTVQAEAKAAQAETEVAEVKAKAAQAEAEVAEVKAKAAQAEAEAAEAKAKAAQAEATAAYTSERVLPFSELLFRRTFRYSASNLGSARSTKFKEALLTADGRNPTTERARCYLLDMELPRHLVIGAHLFKREWSDVAKMLLDIDSVDDARNGLLLYKPLEWAFDTGRLMVVAASGEFVVRLLDPAIREVALHDKATQLLHKSEVEQAKLLGTLTRDYPLPKERSTFGALHDTRARLVLPCGLRPWRRCLCFHAHVVRQQAVRLQWIATKDEAPFEDFWSEGSDVMEHVRHWLEDSALLSLSEGSDDAASSTPS
jgi:hypothetical protein